MINNRFKKRPALQRFFCFICNAIEDGERDTPREPQSVKEVKPVTQQQMTDELNKRARLRKS